MGGIYLNQAAATGWRITFSSAGTFTAASCSGSNLQSAPTPTYTPATVHTVPSNGAIYTDVDAIVSGPVNGRVTVGSGQNIVVAGNIAPVTGGDDVIGLVAYSDLGVAAYAPNVLTWNAAILVETNTSRSTGASHRAGSVMTFTGSAATATGGSFDEYASRIYAYDPNLRFLPPPWFPSIDDTYTTAFFREVKP